MKRHSRLIVTTLGLLCLLHSPLYASGFKYTKQSLDSAVQKGDRTSKAILTSRYSVDSNTIYIDSSGTDMTFTDGSNSAVTLTSLSSSGAPADATYITQTINGTLTNEQALTSLTSGVLTTDSATGVLSTRTVTGTTDEVDVASGSTTIQIGIVDPLGVAKGGTATASYAKGDILVASGATTLTKLTVGSDGQILSSDASTATGVKWIVAPTSGSGTPGGSTSQIQYNSAGSFGGASLITTDTAGLRLSIGPNTTTISLDVGGSFRTVPFELTDGASIALDASRSNFYYVTLGGNQTLANATNPTFGQKIVLMISQDSTGSRKLGFGTNYKFGTDVPSYDTSTTAGTKDYIGMIYNGTSMDVVSISKGYR